MPLPALENWESTKNSLHQASAILGIYRRALLDPDPNWLHVATNFHTDGLTTGPLPFGEIVLNFHTQELDLKLKEGKTESLPLADFTQVSLMEKTQAVLTSAGQKVDLNLDKITHTAPLKTDSAHANDYLLALTGVVAGVNKFRESLSDPKTPAVIWPHGFDLSFLWFSTEKATEKAPHMNFGFSPGSPGLERPYFYAYIWPLPENITAHPLPEHTHWHTEGWTGTVTPYDKLRDLPDPEETITSILTAIFETLSPLI